MDGKLPYFLCQNCRKVFRIIDQSHQMESMSQARVMKRCKSYAVEAGMEEATAVTLAGLVNQDMYCCYYCYVDWLQNPRKRCDGILAGAHELNG